MKNEKHKVSSRIIQELLKISWPIFDARHNIWIYLTDERARSNESRIEHIAKTFHDLKPSDIRYLKEGILSNSRLKEDKRRKDTFNLFFRRKSSSKQYIEICLAVLDIRNRKFKIKTIFVANYIK